MADASDSDLVRQCIQGDNRAFDNLVKKYQGTMYRTALSIVKDPELAKDVTQWGFIKCWEKLRSFDPNYKFYSWLYRIIINEALNRIRTLKKYEGNVSHDSTNGDTPFLQMIEKEKNQQLYKAIEALPEDFQRVIYLRHFEELSYMEIAEVLEIDEKKVKSRLYGARMKLRESLFIDRE